MAVTDAIPDMTSNTAPSGIASSQSDLGGYPAYKCMDDDTATLYHSAEGLPQWVQYQFTVKYTITKYSVTSRATSTPLPTAFNLAGSNDGTNFTTLDTQTGQSFTNGEEKEYSFSNTTGYLYYRITTTAASTNYAAFAEIELEGIVTPDKYDFFTLL